VTSLFDEYFPEVPLVQLPAPDLGNNDLPGEYELTVTSMDPCFPNEDSSPPAATNAWLESTATKFRSLFVNDMEASVFACGGYLNRLAIPKLSIISLNTVVFSLSLTPTISPNDDPFGQFEWLEAQLKEARLSGNKVYITGHIPPVLQSFTGSLGSPLWQEHYGKNIKYLSLDASYIVCRTSPLTT